MQAQRILLKSEEGIKVLQISRWSTSADVSLSRFKEAKFQKHEMAEEEWSFLRSEVPAVLSSALEMSAESLTLFQNSVPRKDF